MMKKQILITRERNSMSLSCRGEITIEDGVITNVFIKGMPRTYGDRWTSFYKNAEIGDKITQEQIDYVLSYDGKANVGSSITTLEGEANEQ